MGTLTQKRELVQKSNFAVLNGVWLAVAGCAASALLPRGSLGPTLLVVFLAAALWSWVTGCRHYALSKGHSARYGLLGILGLIGILLLARFPDKYAITPEAVDGWYPKPEQAA